MRTPFVALCLAIALILAPAAVQALTISAPSVTAEVGDTVTIPISIKGAVDLTAWQFDLAFDPGIVTANGDVTEGPFMSSFGATLFGTGVIDSLTGLISLVTNSYIDLEPYPSGDGVIASIEFIALTPGVSPLTFSNVFLNLQDTGFEVENGQITVTGTQAVPEPTTLIMLAGGLGLLGMRGLVSRGRRE